jgi:hypothetical protein
MARKRKQDDGEERIARGNGHDEFEAEPTRDEIEALEALEELLIEKLGEPVPEDELGEHAPDDEPAEVEPVLPSEDDLERQGFSADEVSRLVLVSKRQEDSAESRFQEAALRRLRFTRWLVEHGRLDEWSA